MNDDPDVFDPTVSQAEGMLCARLGVSIAEAGTLLRVQADVAGVSLHRTAEQVIDDGEKWVDPNIAGSC